MRGNYYRDIPGDRVKKGMNLTMPNCSITLMAIKRGPRGILT